MAVGTVKNLNNRGFGFISTSDGSDMFFHATAVVGRDGFSYMRVGDRVTYEIDDSGDRPRAVEVRYIDEQPQNQPSRGRVSSQSIVNDDDDDYDGDDDDYEDDEYEDDYDEEDGQRPAGNKSGGRQPPNSKSGGRQPGNRRHNSEGRGRRDQTPRRRRSDY